MKSRSKRGVFKPKAFIMSVILPIHHSVLEAMEHLKGIEAMEKEYKALLANETWELVPSPKGEKLIGNKWVFAIKLKLDRSLERYKSLLIAKGYDKVEELDYTKTFSPVVKQATIRIALTLALTELWSIRQLDVNNSSLNGESEDEVFMVQI